MSASDNRVLFCWSGQTEPQSFRRKASWRKTLHPDKWVLVLKVSFTQPSKYSPKFFCFASLVRQSARGVPGKMNLTNKTINLRNNECQPMTTGSCLAENKPSFMQRKVHKFLQIHFCLCFSTIYSDWTVNSFQERIPDKSDSVKWTEPSLQRGSLHVQVKVTICTLENVETTRKLHIYKSIWHVGLVSRKSLWHDVSLVPRLTSKSGSGNETNSMYSVKHETEESDWNELQQRITNYVFFSRKVVLPELAVLR